jgi:hypothetical protein
LINPAATDGDGDLAIGEVGVREYGFQLRRSFGSCIVQPMILKPRLYEHLFR